MGAAGERPRLSAELPARELARLPVLGQRARELRTRPAGTPAEVFCAFLRLGCTSFGGPIAHLGYFRAELVERRGWVSAASYADLVALCQFLPGPASSQVGFALGLIRARWAGGLAAWAGFTLPSALVLTGLATVSQHLPVSGVPHGLALVAVAVVAQAVWSMARALCPDRRRASIAAAGAVAVLLVPAAWTPLAVIALSAAAGVRLCGETEAIPVEPIAAPVPTRWAIASLLVFAVLLAVSLVTSSLAGSFFRSGALVFGGGHVVLPLLHDAMVAEGRVADSTFLAGYGATQAMPGPLFTFAAYLGAAVAGWPGAVVALLAIFVPGLLLVAGVLPFWSRLRAHRTAFAALAGVNAGVVGLLGAALYDPLWRSAVRGPADVAAALAGFVLLVAWRAPPVLVVGLGVVAGLVLAAR